VLQKQIELIIKRFMVIIIIITIIGGILSLCGVNGMFKVTMYFVFGSAIACIIVIIIYSIHYIFGAIAAFLSELFSFMKK
jgi:hypothetical protein